MEQVVVRVGNSIGVVIPQNLRSLIKVNAGDKVIVEGKKNQIVISPVLKSKKVLGGVDTKFAQIVDEFIEDHKDVLQKLANK